MASDALTNDPKSLRFKVIWQPDHGAGYKVSIPNYDGGDVVRAEEYDRIVAVLRSISEMEEETDEWDAVSKFTACKLLAREALTALRQVE